jgi:zinc protease
MNRRFVVILLASVARLVAADEPLPPAAMILDRYVEVTGGKAAYEMHKTEIETGTVQFVALGLKGTLSGYSAEPDKHYSTFDLEGVGKVEEGVSGGVAWENSPLSGPRIKSGEEKAQALREARFNAPAHWREIYTKAETTGVERVGEEDCYKVLLTPAQGNAVTMYFGKKSGLMKKTTVVAASQFGDLAAELIASEYREFGGVLAPAKMTQKAAGQELTITINDVKVNQEIPPDRFELPAEVKALLNQPAK